MSPDDFKGRTKAYALRIIRLFEALPHRGAPAILGRQLLRAGASVGTNYRSACRAKSRADFISKMGTVQEECDETLYWLELLVESDFIKAKRVKALMNEGGEILALVIASIRTARGRRKSAIRNPQSAME
jgi:four helix bundle protein